MGNAARGRSSQVVIDVPARGDQFSVCGVLRNIVKSRSVLRRLEMCPSSAQEAHCHSMAPVAPTLGLTAPAHLMLFGQWSTGSGWVAATMTLPRKSAILRPGQHFGPIAPLSSRKWVTSVMYIRGPRGSIKIRFAPLVADCQPVDQSLPTQLTNLGGQLDQRRQPVDRLTEGLLSAYSVEKLTSKT